jgi:hypothetical protein
VVGTTAPIRATILLGSTSYGTYIFGSSFSSFHACDAIELGCINKLRSDPFDQAAPLLAWLVQHT